MNNNNNGNGGNVGGGGLMIVKPSYLETRPNKPVVNGRVLVNTPYENISDAEVQDDPDAGYYRSMTPEYVLGGGCIDPKHMVCIRSRLIPSFFSSSPVLSRTLDYTSVGPVGQGRAAAEAVMALYPNNGQIYPMVNGADYSEATFNSDADSSSTVGPSLGFVLDWGVKTLDFTPFDLVITTTGWRNMGTILPTNGHVNASVDRTVILRVQESAGGSIYVPWATRIVAPLGSMQDAIVQVGQALPIVEEVGNQSSIKVSNIPAALIGSFAARVSFMTAGHPNLATWIQAAKLYGDASQVTSLAGG